ELVNVRWDADTITIANSEPAIRVISLTRPTGIDSHCDEANTRIRLYLASELATNERSKASE
ncbi:MAG: hypothetical protein AAFU85_28715, partial [Planctomycetota bacterium]